MLGGQFPGLGVVGADVTGGDIGAIQRIKGLRAALVDAVNIPDGPQASEPFRHLSSDLQGREFPQTWTARHATRLR